MGKNILSRDFYLRPVQIVASELLGMRLVRSIGEKRVGGTIVETEAYDGEQDLACHARMGETERNKVMYSLGGFAYIYFTYGMHWMLNCVTGEKGYPSAVLIRSIRPLEGLDTFLQNRPNTRKENLSNGPAKLTKALAINGELNGVDLCNEESGLWIEKDLKISSDEIKTTPRIGIHSTPEPWLSKPWRFFISLP